MQKPENLNTSLNDQHTEKLTTEIKQNEKEIKNPKKFVGESSYERKQNICTICHKSFSTSGNMRNHIITIHQNYRPFKCCYQGCKKEYSIESRYLVHLRTHKGEKPFVCKICNKSFNEKGNLKTHLRFHSELRPFKCPYCNKSYKTNGHLKDHIDIKHRKIKKYNCEFCDKKFGRISTLKAHNRTHTGEKNYKCKLEGCNKCFAEKGNMEMHYQRHLKKLNKNINEIIEKKKYGKKKIELDYEQKIKEAIDGLNSMNQRKDNTIKNDSTKVNHKKSSHALFVNAQNNNSTDDSNLFFSKETMKNDNFVNKGILNNSLINVNISLKNDNINNNCRIINENNFKENSNNVFKNNNNLNNYSNIEQNMEHIGNENQNFFGCLDFCSLMQDFNQMEPLNGRENKGVCFLNKESNEINYDFSNCVTRPTSNTTLCMQQKQNDIFAKEEDLFSEDEDSPKDNESKNMSDNSFLNENTNLRFNQKYDFLEGQQNYLNDNKMNIFTYNFNDMSESKNIKGQEFLDKNYMI